jgi:hypothetical protein
LLFLQLQTILSEEICSKLLAWYSFQVSKGTADEITYYANCVDVLREDKCFRFESVVVSQMDEKKIRFIFFSRQKKKSPDDNPGFLTIQYLDTNSNLPAFVDFSIEKQEVRKKKTKHKKNKSN